MDCGDRNIDSQFTNTIGAGQVTANEYYVAMPAQGTTQFTRQGREITNVEVEWRWDGNVVAAEDMGTPVSIRFIVDTQANAVTPAGGIATLVYVADQISSLDNLEWEDRFVEVDRVDYDCIGNMGPQAWQCGGCFNLEEKVKLANVNSGTVSACEDMALYVLVYSNGALSHNTEDTLNVRVRFQVE